jgi:hypothetical protein
MIGSDKEFLVASYNVCTLYQSDKLQQLSVGYKVQLSILSLYRSICISDNIIEYIYGMINITINLYIPVRTKIAAVGLVY